MLPQKDWESRLVETGPRVIYSFEKGLSMSPVGVLSADSAFFSEHVEWVYPEQHIARIVTDSFKQVREVKSICAQFDSDGIVIWTLLESYNREARERIYERELAICEKLGIYDFDFRVTSIELVSVSDLVKGGLTEIFKRS